MTTTAPALGDDAPYGVPATERAFYVDEFAGATLVVSIAAPSAAVLEAIGRAAAALADGGARLVLVVGREDGAADRLGAVLPEAPVVLEAPPTPLDDAWLADLWLAITDRHEVVVATGPGHEALVGAQLGVALRALKLVITDDRGGWGRPPRSFADVATHADAFRAQLHERQGGAVVAALELALAGGVTNVNLCRPEDLDRELFTFDGAGTLFSERRLRRGRPAAGRRPAGR
ncbi:MAG: hypothetical protein U0P45_00665 [Acidimicrobiales bacterium]